MTWHRVTIASLLFVVCATFLPTCGPTKGQPLITRDAPVTVAPSNVAQIQRQDKIFGQFPCAEDGTRPFTTPIFATDLITEILPLGQVSSRSGHVTPTDHLYVHRDAPAAGDVEYVLAPADGIIVRIGRSGRDKPLDRDDSSSPLVPDHRVVLMHSCTFFTIFIHLGELSPAVADQTGAIALGDTWFSTRTGPIQLKAGEPIAKFGQLGFDWSVHDADTTLAGFVIPEHYKSEPWKVHTVDPFQFYEKPLRSELVSKIVRQVAPRAGKIDYDVEGRIVGNWFREGTIDYSGNVAPGTPEYWAGHLSIAYSYLDPTQIRIAIGFDTGIREDLYCRGCYGSYGVRGNDPDPASVGPEFGLVKYELMSKLDSADSDPMKKEQVGSTSLGTFLVQHLGARTIRVEVVPGNAPSEISGFSDASLIYHR